MMARYPTTPDGDRLLSVEDVASMVRRSVHWVHKNVPKSMRYPGTKRWPESTIHEWARTPPHERERPEPIPRKWETYFIRNPVTGLMKIGRATDSRTRLRQLELNAGVRLNLVAVIEDNVEASFHERYAEQRVIGEWFKTTPELIDEIDDYLVWTEGDDG